MNNFIIFSLPRSGSYWLSKFLTYKDYYCGHDQLKYARSLEDVESWLNMDKTGSVETSGCGFWRLVPEGVKVGVLARNVETVARSGAALGYEPGVILPALNRQAHKLRQIQARLNAFPILYNDLFDLNSARVIWKYFLPYDFDISWWRNLKQENLQFSAKFTQKYYNANKRQLDDLTYYAKTESIRRLKCH